MIAADTSAAVVVEHTDYRLKTRRSDGRPEADSANLEAGNIAASGSVEAAAVVVGHLNMDSNKPAPAAADNAAGATPAAAGGCNQIVAANSSWDEPMAIHTDCWALVEHLH